MRPNFTGPAQIQWIEDESIYTVKPGTKLVGMHYLPFHYGRVRSKTTDCSKYGGDRVLRLWKML
jgi:hypothetical protein